jgi:hypothetical protein
MMFNYFTLFSCFTIFCICEPSTLTSGPLQTDFIQWLNSQKAYINWTSTFVRSDLGNYGSYGGKTSSEQTIKNTPVVFIHGNSDQALNSGHGSQYQTGWTASIQFFEQQGYTSAELYATTWGPANSLLAVQQTHSCAYVAQIRQFIQAVLDYTQAEKIHVISHSMGVTLARKAIKGGMLKENTGASCNIGDPLTDQVDTFVGIAGGNRGLANCISPLLPTCNTVNGFYPGTCITGFCQQATALSKYLFDLDSEVHYEGQNVFVIWSQVDEVIGYHDIVYGYPTSEINGQDGEYISSTLHHEEMKDQLCSIQ